MPVKHSFVSAVPDGPAGDVVRPVDWNAEHVVEGLQLASGFPLDANMAYGVALTYDPGTRKVTLTPTLASFDIYVRGTKITTTGVHESVAHGAGAANYYYYHDGSAFVWATDPWPFDEAPICYVVWLGADGVGYFELHTTSRDPNIHRVLHFSQGTQVQTRGAITGYTPSTDSDVAVTYAIAQTVILDEDIQYTLTALADGGPYTIWWRTTAGAWTYTEGATLPFKYGTYPQWNRISDFTLVDLGSLEYCNYYVFATPALETQQQFIIVPGQAMYSSLAGAQAESVSGLSFGTLPFQEIAPLYKITMRARNTYGGTAKCMIEAVETLVGTRVSVTSTAVPNHNALAGLQGGAAAEYYHLTAAELVEVQALDSAAFVPTSTFQPADPQLTSLAGLLFTGNALKVIRVSASETAFELVTPTAGSLADGDYGDIVVSGTGTVWSIDSAVATTAGRALMDDADNTAQRTTLGLGTSATQAETLLYVAAGADTAVNNASDVTIITKDVTGVAAGDTLYVDAWFTLLNNSTATRVYVITLDFDGLFDVEISTGAMAFSSTLIHPFHVYGVCDVRASNLVYGMMMVDGTIAAGTSMTSGGDSTMAATHLQGKGWGTSTSDATGTLTVALKVRSANATATQTLRLHHFTIRKYAARSL